jgi:hypothetical protein
MSAYWPPLEDLLIFDVLVFRNAQDVVDYSVVSGTTSKIALTSDDSSTTSYIPFSKTTSATSNTLYIDNLTTPLRYRPDTGEVSAQRLSVGGILNPTAGDIATRFFQFASGVFEIRNQATGDKIRLVSLDAVNTAINVFSISTTDLTTITTNCPIITGFTDPAAADSTDKIASTRWVQSAITAGGTAATTVLVTDNNTATIYYPTFALTGTGQKSLFSDFTTTPLSYQPSSSTLTATNFSGLASQSTTVAVADNDTSTIMYPIFTTATAGQKSLLFDSTTTPLRYIPDVGVMSAVKFAVGAFADPVSGDNAGYISHNAGSSATVIQNQATSGLINLAVRDAVNTLTIPFQLSSSNLTITTTNNPTISAKNIVVDNGAGNPITVGNGASTATSNIIMTSLSLASTRNFTLGGNVIIGSVAGNGLGVAATDNTFIGDSAGSSATGSTNICIGYNSQVPTAASNNQIAIGTASETMYIRGGFNLRVGTQITATISLAAVVLAQFYTVAMAAAAQTITLPNPTTAAYLGATVTFKRKTNTTVFSIAAAGVTPFVLIGSITLTASPISIAATVFQVDLVCDGTNWCIISQA